MDRMHFDPDHGFASRHSPIRLSDEQVKAIYNPEEFFEPAPSFVSMIAFCLAFVLLGVGWFLIANADSFLP